MLMRIPNKEDSLIKRTISIYVVVSGPVHTYAFLKVWVFVVIENAWSIRVHTLVLSRFDCLHYNVRKQLNYTLWRRLNSMRILQTRVCDIFGLSVVRYVIVFILVRFRPFSNTICARFCFDPLSRAFSNMKTSCVVMWTEGPNASKYIRFQTKMH